MSEQEQMHYSKDLTCILVVWAVNKSERRNSTSHQGRMDELLDGYLKRLVCWSGLEHGVAWAVKCV